MISAAQKFSVQAGQFIADPVAVPGAVPVFGVFGGPSAAGEARAHEIFRGVGCVVGHKLDIIYLDIGLGRDGDIIMDVAVIFHIAPAAEGNAALLGISRPGDKAVIVLLNGEILRGEGDGFVFDFNDEIDAGIQHLTIIDEDVLRETVLGKPQRFARGLNEIAFDLHRSKGCHRMIVHSQCGIEPAQTGVPPQFAVAFVGDGLLLHINADVQDLRRNWHAGFGIVRGEGDLAGISAGDDVFRDLHAAPKCLHFSFGYIHIEADRAAVPVRAFQIKAGDLFFVDPGLAVGRDQIRELKLDIRDRAVSGPGSDLPDVVFIAQSSAFEMRVLPVLDPADGQLMLQADRESAVFQKEDGILRIFLCQIIHFFLGSGQSHRGESVKLGTAFKTLHLCGRKGGLVLRQSPEPVGVAQVGQRQIIIPRLAVAGIIPIPAVVIGQIIDFVIRVAAGPENDGRFL